MPDEVSVEVEEHAECAHVLREGQHGWFKLVGLVGEHVLGQAIDRSEKREVKALGVRRKVCVWKAP